MIAKAYPKVRQPVEVPSCNIMKLRVISMRTISFYVSVNICGEVKISLIYKMVKSRHIFVYFRFFRNLLTFMVKNLLWKPEKTCNAWVLNPWQQDSKMKLVSLLFFKPA